MSKLFALGVLTLAGLSVAPSAGALEPLLNTGTVCQPKTSADAGRIRYNGVRVMNTSTTSTATVTCPVGYQRWASVGVNVYTGKTISCTAYYLDSTILSSYGTKTQTGGGVTYLNWDNSPMNIGETAYIDCTIPTAAGAAESKMSSVDVVRGS